MVKRISGLARVLSEVATSGAAVEQVADGILGVVKQTGIRDLARFDEAIQAAYTANGWKATQGRPANGEQAPNGAVPRSVKTYVSEVRRGFRIGLRFGRISSFAELRMKLAAARERKRLPRVKGPEELTGVKLSKPDALIGHPFHDLSVIYAALSPDQQAVLKKQVDRLCTHYKKHLPKLAAAQDKTQQNGRRALAVAVG